MTAFNLRLVTVAILTMAGSAAFAADEPAGPLQSEEIKWGAAPQSLPAGVELAVLAGDPGKIGPVTIRLKMPAGYEIPSHWHTADERVTVISGDLGLGVGDTIDKKSATVLRSGGYAVAMANMHHFAWTPSGAVVQIDMMGPFDITYVNAIDKSGKKQ